MKRKFGQECTLARVHSKEYFPKSSLQRVPSRGDLQTRKFDDNKKGQQILSTTFTKRQRIDAICFANGAKCRILLNDLSCLWVANKKVRQAQIELKRPFTKHRTYVNIADFNLTVTSKWEGLQHLLSPDKNKNNPVPTRLFSIVLIKPIEGLSEKNHTFRIAQPTGLVNAMHFSILKLDDTWLQTHYERHNNACWLVAKLFWPANSTNRISSNPQQPPRPWSHPASMPQLLHV